MKRRYPVLFFFLLSLAVFLPNPIFPAEVRKPFVAVLWFENRTPDRELDYLDQLIPDLITTELSGLHFCDILEREEIERSLDEIILSRQGFVSPGERIKGGIAETTDFILSGYFEKKEEGLVVSVRLYDWKKGTSKTKDFTYSLFEIKERAGKEITEYLQRSITLKEVGDERLLTVSENTPGVTIFLDIRHTFFNFDDAYRCDTIYDYPYGAIFLEELSDALQSRGISCEIVTGKENWDRILQKDSVPVQPTRVYQVFINARCGDVYPPPPFTIRIRDLGTTDSPINPQTARDRIKSKEFSAPFSSFASLKDDVSRYILGSVGIETYASETSSPKTESLIYYANYLRQKRYGDYTVAYQEILKALYLYPDFSFYWFVLKESCYPLEKHEKERQVTEIYLGLSSWNEHPLIYSDSLRIYILKLGERNMLAAGIAVRIIPLLERIIYESDDSKWRKKDLALLLSRLYLLGEAGEIKTGNLRGKGLISEAECQNDRCWALLMNKLGFTKEEGVEAVNWSLSRDVDWENYSNWSAGIIPFVLPDSVLARFGKNVDKQKEFLLTVGETAKSYPDAITNCYVIKNLSKRFDHDLVERELAKISEKIPDSLTSCYIRFLRLEEEFFSTEGDKKQLIKAIAGICDTLGDESLIKDFLQESVRKKVDEETLLLLFLELVKRVKTNARIGLINNTAPKSIRSRLESELGLNRGEPGEEGIKSNLPSPRMMETRVLVDAELKNLKEAIESVGWGTEIFSKETDLSNLSKYRLIVLHLSSLGSWDKNGGFVFQPVLLSRIIAGLDNGIFILIIPGKSTLIPKVNPLLSQFNCYIDEEKEVGSEAVFLPGIFKNVMDAHLEYHSRIRASPGVSWQWEKFFIKSW